MKYFISYKFSETPIETIHAAIDPIMALLTVDGDKAYCNLYDEPMYQKEGYDTRQIMQHALSHLCTMSRDDLHITYVDIATSEGMLIEFGYALRMGVPRLLLIKKDLKSNSARALSDFVIEFQTPEGLLKDLKEFIDGYTPQKDDLQLKNLAKTAIKNGLPVFGSNDEHGC